MLPIQTILHPTDFSDRSACAFQFACAQARDYGACLVVAHVCVPELVVYGEMRTPVPAVPVVDRPALQARLAQLQPADPAVRVEHVLREGDPALEILALAGELSCDLIVLGTHGRTGFHRLLMGSVAEAVSRKAPCPVLTVKAPLAEPIPHDSAYEEAVQAWTATRAKPGSALSRRQVSRQATPSSLRTAPGEVGTAWTPNWNVAD
jgi:nucleotide-binding universal stress UspA family protein